MAKEKSSWISELYTVNERRNFISVAVMLGLGVAVAAIASKGLKGAQTNKYYEDVANPAKAAFFAERLWHAFEYYSFFGGFTDEDEIYRVLNEVPDKKMWLEVQAKYKLAHNEDLMFRLGEELSGEEKQKALDIIKQRGLA